MSQKPKKKEEPQYPPFDLKLDEYAERYSGHARINRLKFIGEHCKELRTDALKQAAELVKKTLNSALYQEILNSAEGQLGPPDAQWIDAVDRRSQATLEKLEMELNGFKTNLVKDSIRQGHIDLGRHHMDRGDTNAALKCFVRIREYCTDPQHVIDMCMHVVKVGIEMNNMAHVASYVAKAEQTPELTDDQIIAQLKCASGLVYLYNKKYKLAAKKFMEVNGKLGDSFNDIISAHDVALYGGLCALATFDRSELKHKVIDDTGPFKSVYLDLVPQVHEAIVDFYNSRYAKCFQILDSLKVQCQLDLQFSAHVNNVFGQIRSKALVQYFTPYKTVDLNLMAKAFNTTEPGLEKELTVLIMDGVIHARIDAQAKVLYARMSDARSLAYEATLEVGDDYQEEVQDTMLRVNMLRQDILVRAPIKAQSRGMQQQLMNLFGALRGGF